MKHGPRTKAAALLALLHVALVAVAGCSGKGAEGSCGATATCGGNPVGTWTVAGDCQFHADMPYQPVSLVEQMQSPLTPSVAPPQAEPTTTGDWCAQLVYLPPDSSNPGGSVRDVTLWHDAPSLQGGTLSFMGAPAGGSYSVALNFTTVSSMHFAPSCMQSAGATPTCDDLAAGLTAFYTKAAMNRAVTGGPPPTPGFDQIGCAAASDQGCDCSYNYSVALTDQGDWAANGGVLTESSIQYLYNGQAVRSQTPTAPMAAGFCQSGSSMTLTGESGASLSSAVGLRSLSLLMQ